MKVRKSFFVHGHPKSFALVANQRGKSYLPKRVRDWKKTVELVCKQVVDENKLSGPLRVDLVFCFKTPKSRGLEDPDSPRYQWHVVRPDRDNLAKAVQDSLGEFWGDDCQVVVGETAKVYSDALEGVLVYVENTVDVFEELERMGALAALDNYSKTAQKWKDANANES